MRELGQLDPRSIKGGSILSSLSAFSRELMTYGSAVLGGPKLPYFVANLMSAPEMLMMTSGAARGAAGIGRAFAHPRIVASMVKRNALGYSPAPAADDVLKTFTDGRGTYGPSTNFTRRLTSTG